MATFFGSFLEDSNDLAGLGTTGPCEQDRQALANYANSFHTARRVCNDVNASRTARDSACDTMRRLQPIIEARQAAFQTCMQTQSTQNAANQYMGQQTAQQNQQAQRDASNAELARRRALEQENAKRRAQNDNASRRATEAQQRAAEAQARRDQEAAINDAKAETALRRQRAEEQRVAEQRRTEGEIQRKSKQAAFDRRQTTDTVDSGYQPDRSGTTPCRAERQVYDACMARNTMRRNELRGFGATRSDIRQLDGECTTVAVTLAGCIGSMGGLGSQDDLVDASGYYGFGDIGTSPINPVRTIKANYGNVPKAGQLRKVGKRSGIVAPTAKTALAYTKELMLMPKMDAFLKNGGALRAYVSGKDLVGLMSFQIGQKLVNSTNLLAKDIVSFGNRFKKDAEKKFKGTKGAHVIPELNALVDTYVAGLNGTGKTPLARALNLAYKVIKSKKLSYLSKKDALVIKDSTAIWAGNCLILGAMVGSSIIKIGKLIDKNHKTVGFELGIAGGKPVKLKLDKVPNLVRPYLKKKGIPDFKTPPKKQGILPTDFLKRAPSTPNQVMPSIINAATPCGEGMEKDASGACVPLGSTVTTPEAPPVVTTVPETLTTTGYQENTVPVYNDPSTGTSPVAPVGQTAVDVQGTSDISTMEPADGASQVVADDGSGEMVATEEGTVEGEVVTEGEIVTEEAPPVEAEPKSGGKMKIALAAAAAGALWYFGGDILG